jgi:hypothetical protein
MNKYLNIVFAILIIGIYITNVSAQNLYTDSTYLYKNGNDSTKVLYKRNRVYKRLDYFPNGKIKTSVTILKDEKTKKGQKTKYIYESWDEQGKKISKQRQKVEVLAHGGTRVIWTFIKDGKYCLKRYKGPLGSKF